MITQESIEEVKERANLIELIGESTSLKRQGSSFVGLCPFHSEKTGSFHIRENGRFYHCFGCGASGNSISYYMHTRGVSFPQAVEELAERFGVALKFTKGKEVDKPKHDKSVFYEINKLAVEFFTKALKSSPEAVKKYIKERQLKAETIQAFSIGFSLPSWNALSDNLKSKKITEENILTAGLARRNPKGDLYDVFRARLIFPIYSDNRKVVAFGGRLIPELIDNENAAQAPKYLNSPDNPVYQKNKILFGLPQAFNAIRENGFVYIVEGYMDVISLWQTGVKNVLATCGTALSQGHIKRLSYLCKRAYVLFDGDNAGRTAASKAFTLFLNSGIEAQILFLPDKDDPDSIACRHKEDTGAYLQSLEKHSLISCYIDSLFSRYSVKSVKELGAALKGQVADEVSQLLKSVKNAVERSELINEAAFKLMIDKSLLDNISPSKQFVADTENIGTPEEAGISIKSVNDLPRLDQEILRIVMAKKLDVIERMLNEADLCLSLEPCTLTFIESLSILLANNSFDSAEKKEAIKILLKEYGESWLKLWKQAHDMSAEKGVDFLQSFEQCLQLVKKSKLNQSLMELDGILQMTAEENTKIELAQKRLGLIRQINAI
jgi:DNA primase